MDAFKAIRRFFHLTPNRLLVALLPIWGVLFLAEHFHWLPKGYPVLFAVASSAAMLLLLLLWFIAALVFRWRFQFSIRSLLFLTLIASIWGSWFGVEMRAARRQRAAVEAIQKLGGGVDYGWSGNVNRQPPGPAWLRRVLGEGFFGTVSSVSLMESQVTDGDMDNLKEMTQLWALVLSQAKVSDAGLEPLEGLTQLHLLHLTNTQVSDAGLKPLEGLTQLEELYLDGTRVSDVGLCI